MTDAPTEFAYTPDWLKTQTGTHPWGTRALLGAMAHLGIPRTMLDIGCGDGYLVDFARSFGIDALGVDIAPESTDTILRRDLREPINLDRVFDLVISWETGEHLPPESADTFADSLVRHVGRFLVFTAAIPGQGGDGHINCQPFEYWRDRLTARGLTYRDDATEHIRHTWIYSTGPCVWYPQNIQVFENA